jgi:hypothetical protein
MFTWTGSLSVGRKRRPDGGLPPPIPFFESKSMNMLNER